MQQFHKRSYGGEKLGDDLYARARLQFKNLWKVDIVGERQFYEIDTRQLRGGPSLRIDGSSTARIFIQTNSSKNLFLGGGPQFIWNDDGVSVTRQGSFYVQWMINNRISLSSNTSLSLLTDNNQYVLQKVVNDKREYIVGTINRKTFSSIIRAEWFVTPELSFQYYGNPYASVGQYDNYRKVADSKSSRLQARYLPLTIITSNGNKILTDESRNPVILNLSVSNPDFNYREFRSNFVARWEYKTGSTIYFVWTNNRYQNSGFYEPSLFKSLKGITNVKAENVFMVKLSFWFTV